MGILRLLAGLGPKPPADDLEKHWHTFQKLFKDFKANFDKRDKLVTSFNFEKIRQTREKALTGPLDVSWIEPLIVEFFKLTANGLVVIKDEMTSEEKTLKDMERLLSDDHSTFIRNTHSELYDKIDSRLKTKEKIWELSALQKHFATLMHSWYEIMEVEMRLCHVILVRFRLRPDSPQHQQINKEAILLYTSNLVSLFKNKERSIFRTSVMDHPEKVAILKAIMFGEKLEDLILTADDIFMDEMVAKMGADKRSIAKKLAEFIYESLLDQCRPTKRSTDTLEAGDKFEALLEDDGALVDLIRKFNANKRNKSPYTEEQIPIIINAFRKHFDFEKLEEAMLELVT